MKLCKCFLTGKLCAMNRWQAIARQIYKQDSVLWSINHSMVLLIPWSFLSNILKSYLSVRSMTPLSFGSIPTLWIYMFLRSYPLIKDSRRDKYLLRFSRIYALGTLVNWEHIWWEIPLSILHGINMLWYVFWI